MSIFKAYKSDTSRENNGVKVEMGSNDDGSIIRFYLCRIGGSNKEQKADLTKRSNPYLRQIQNGLLDETIAEKIQLENFCYTVLKGWENVQKEDGTVIEYNYLNSVALMGELPDLYNELLQKAQSISTFQNESLEAVEKN